ncbi:hypothetical protein HKCCE2091_09265 [Rhodobacterales bacterium HKCCE2091]|nr:hypothetical protein [Rhodobacterales bacterium HKCCE2091]
MTEWVESGGTGRAYADWEAAEAGPGADDQTVPLFLAVSIGGDQGDTEGSAARAALTSLRTGGLILAEHEADRLLTEFRAVLRAGLIETWVFRLVGYARRGDIPAIEAHPLVTLLHVGAPMPRDAASHLPDPDPTSRLPKGTALQPPVAVVIDDGIPFLNAIFRKGGSTAIEAVWLQSDRMPHPVPGEEEVGLVIRKNKINAAFAEQDERQVYRETNLKLLPITARASTDFRISHGAHVMDIALGGEPNVPIFAVQLPPSAVADTSGRLNGRFVVQGLRWSILQALKLNQKAGAGPVVANLSLGSLAGPGDKTGFLASWLDYEVRAYRVMTDCDLRVVCAYGNSHREKLAARAKVTADAPMRFEWCVQPEDFTSSFIELRVEEADTAGLSISVTPPRAGPATRVFTWADAQKGWHWTGPDGTPLAAILKLDESPGDGRTTAILLATAATNRRRGGPAAPAGAWKIEVTGAGPTLVTALVQRDDTPAGYRPFGRQSWIDSPASYIWDFQTRDWIKPDEAITSSFDPRPTVPPNAGPVTRAGTAVAHAGATAETVVFVGSVKPILGFPDKRVSTLYSAEGIPADATIYGIPARRDGESEGPNLTALADDGSNLYGRLGSGVISGSMTRLSGTSVAAPAVTRRYLMLYKAQSDAHMPIPAAEIPLSDLLSVAPATERDPITGYGILKDQRPYTLGRDLSTLPPPATFPPPPTFP